jgi:hypothetical protein
LLVSANQLAYFLAHHVRILAFYCLALFLFLNLLQRYIN